MPGTTDAAGPGAERQFKKAHMFRVWSRFDSHFMKPLLTHSRPCLVETLPHCLFYVARFFTSEEQLYATINEREPRIPPSMTSDNGVPSSVKLSELNDDGIFQGPESGSVLGSDDALNGGSGSGARLRLAALHMNFGSLDLNETGIFSPPGSGSRPPHFAAGPSSGPASPSQEKREPSADSQLMDVTLDPPGAASSTAPASAASDSGSTRSVGLDDPKV